MFSLLSRIHPRRLRALLPAAMMAVLAAAFTACGGGNDWVDPYTPPPTPPSITAFTATPASITAGESSTLSWTVTNATSLSINQGVGVVTGTTKVVSPTLTTVYTLTATGAGGTKTATATVSVKGTESPFLKANGTTLRNTKGQGAVVVLRGTNLGGWLLQENWMSPLGTTDEWTLRNTLTSTFGAATCESLIAAHQDTWIKTWDLDQIQSTGMNMVRVPIYYLGLVNDNGSAWSWKADPWSRLDWIVSECAKRNLYVLLDLHGAPGAQNMWDNSGRANTDPQLWKSTYNQDLTDEIWKAIATRYKGQEWVAGYDLLNEPSGPSSAFTLDKAMLNAFYDRLYKTIRAVDPDHAIFMEGFPGTAGLQSPAIKGWTNVVYEFHSYAMATYKGNVGQGSIWTEQRNLSNAIINDAKGLRDSYQVPIYVGEFCLFDFKDVWAHLLAGLNKEGISWSPWAWKVKGGDPANGDMAGNWGFYIHGTGTAPAVTGSSSTQIETAWRTWDTQTHFLPNTDFINLVKAYATGSTTEPASTATFYSIQVGGKFVSADANSVPFTGLADWQIPMMANRTQVGDWEAFELVDNGDATISIRAKINTKFVTADKNHGYYLAPAAYIVQDWEKFTKTDLGDGTFSLKASVNGQYVSMAASGALIANSATPVAFTFTKL